MTRRDFLPVMATPALVAQPSRPNIVFVLIDDLRPDALGCTGHSFSITPQIDRLAKEGARFTNAFVTTPLCSPSRASYLTGRYVHAHGVTGNGDNAALSHNLVTFPRLLHDAGYETAYMGKWHMGTDDSPRPGFDRWISFRGQGQFEDPPMNIDGKQIKATGYMTNLLSQHAVDFIRKPHTKPFCLYLAHKAVHAPFTPEPRYKDHFSSNPIVRSANAKDDLRNKPAMTRLVEGRPAVQPSGGSSDELIRNQLRCLRSIDDGIGEMLRALEETKQLDNSVFVFTSDNGYFWGEHGLGDKRWAHEESIRIPLIFRYPKMAPQGMTIPHDALNIDIAPTMLAFGGLKPPKDVHGRSLLPLFRREAPSGWRTSFLAEYFEEGRFPRTPTWQAIRTPRWKYIRYPTLQDSDELYDLASDPGEMRNIINDSAISGTLKNLRQDLEKQLKATV